MFDALYAWYLSKRIIYLRKQNAKLTDKLHYKYGSSN